MKKASLNPLFVSALDILTGALGVFIVLNFLQTRLPQLPAQPVAENKTSNAPPVQGKFNKPGKGDYKSRTRPQQPVNPAPPPPPAPPEVPPPAPVVTTPTGPPVQVDLMKQTQGAVAILLQQPDQSKTSLEFMLRQGSKTWKPSRASKYQNDVWSYDRRLGYFFQEQITPGTYEVLVRVKKGSRGSSSHRFALYGKIIPAGQGTVTFTFGNFTTGNSGDWVPAGILTVQPGTLNYKSRLNDAPPSAPSSPTPPNSEKPAKKSGKWG